MAAMGEVSLEDGDLLIAATDVEEATLDFRKGISGAGRILHCDHAMRVKRELWTGEQGLVVGLAIDPATATLYSTNPQGYSFVLFDRHGDRLPGPAFLPRRRWGNLLFAPDGRAIAGVHSFHGEAPDDAYGDGKLARFDPRSGAVEFFTIEIDGGRGGKHCVSNLALAPDGRTVFYVSEAGRRVLRYDIEQRQQLPDFRVFGEDEGRGTYGVQVLPDGRVLMATGTGAALFDKSGAELLRYDVPAVKGWTRAKLSLDGVHFYLGNFLDGILERRRISDGAVVDRFDVQRKGSLTSVVEYRS
jgi:SMP-30/Gluconolactonase/LRE-like region